MQSGLPWFTPSSAQSISPGNAQGSETIGEQLRRIFKECQGMPYHRQYPESGELAGGARLAMSEKVTEAGPIPKIVRRCRYG